MKSLLTTTRVAALALGLAVSSPLISHAQKNYKPTKENLAAREKFRDRGFGIFLHWGLYSIFGQGEWYMTNANLNRDEYSKVAGAFYPAQFDAAKWVAAIKASGAGYLTITSRHHEGFSMWDTKQSDYNIIKSTPFKRDILAELVRDYNAEAIWFDGEWDQDINPGFQWNFDKMYAGIHKINPACLIGNNHHGEVHPGEDFQMFERDVPGANTAGLSGQAISKLPIETCQTMNGMWGYKIIDQTYKSDTTLIRLLVQTAGRNANLLLNIGPEATGALPATAIDRLEKIGKWMKTYGKTVKDGVREGIIPPQEWGVSTQKGKTIYLHILDWKSRMLSLPLTEKVKSVVAYDTRRPIPFQQTKLGLTLSFDKAPSEANAIDYIVEVTLH